MNNVDNHASHAKPSQSLLVAILIVAIGIWMSVSFGDRWEYAVKRILLDKDQGPIFQMEQLNKEGYKGWELVEIRHDHPDWWTAVFKRPLWVWELPRDDE